MSAQGGRAGRHAPPRAGATRCAHLPGAIVAAPRALALTSGPEGS